MRYHRISAAMTLAVLLQAGSARSGSSVENLVFNRIEPCRVLDTSKSSDGPLLAGETRSFDVVGDVDLRFQGGDSATGCGIPGWDLDKPQVQAIVVHYFAKEPASAGVLKAWAADSAEPKVETLSFGVGRFPLDIGFGAVTPVRQDVAGQDINITASEQVDLVATVVGYYTTLRTADERLAAAGGTNLTTRDTLTDLIVNPGLATIGQAAHPASAPEKLNVNGNIRLLTANAKITSNTGLVLEETGDTLGTMRLSIVNRFQQAGALFEQLATGGAKGVADFIFKPDVDQPNLRRNLRLEARFSNDFVLAPEFQIGAPDDPTLVVADTNSAFRKGNLGVGTASPTEKIDVVGGNIRTNGQLISTSVGGAPMVVSSTTKVGNLNADMLDGFSESSFFRLDQGEAVTGVPQFNGGTSGSTAPFTVDSTEVVANLNADLLDGFQGSSYLRSNASDSFTSGTLTVASAATLNVDGSLKIGASSATNNDSIFFDDGSTEVLAWSNSESRFELSDQLAVGGAIAVGATDITPVAYSRFGSGGTPLATDVTNSSDVFVQGDLEAGDRLYADKTIVVGDPTPTENQPYSSFGSGVPDTADITNANDVYISGDLEVDQTIYLALGSTAGSQVVCRNTSTLQLSVCSSSRKFKHDIQDLKLGLETVEKLRPVSFVWNQGGMKDLGFVAEEVEALDPLLATYDDQGQLAGVKYTQMTAILTNAVQEQQAQIQKQRDQIASLEARLAALEKPVDFSAIIKQSSVISGWMVLAGLPLVAFVALRKRLRSER